MMTDPARRHAHADPERPARGTRDPLPVSKLKVAVAEVSPGAATWARSRSRPEGRPVAARSATATTAPADGRPPAREPAGRRVYVGAEGDPRSPQRARYWPCSPRPRASLSDRAAPAESVGGEVSARSGSDVAIGRQPIPIPSGVSVDLRDGAELA